jgi:23S rRNA pseudouridine955/2504/2580 synthase
LVRAYLAESLAPSLSFRPGPLHRLDRPSSGIIVFSTSLEGARAFSTLIRERRLKKSYLALVEGRVAKAEVWRDALVRDRNVQKTYARKAAGSKTALTRVQPLAVTAGRGDAAYTLLLAEIETGRTHQIRAQAAARGHPLAGDIKYGGHVLNGAEGLRGGFFLHAWKLELRETPSGTPASPPLPRSLSSPPPPAFQKQLRAIFGEQAIGGLI